MVNDIMMKMFDNPDFIPDNSFCNHIKEDDQQLVILKFSADGRICIINSDKIDYYLKSIEETPNKFLKLAYFEYIKKNLEINDYYKLLNKFRLIPLYYDVALNIVLQENIRYNPRWLLEEYIKLSHKASIENQTVFNNIGQILKLVIEKNKDPSGILQPFIQLDGKVLRSSNISIYVFNAIDYWINNLFSGNITTDIYFTDKILSFYEKVDMPNEIETKKSIFAKKYLNFIETELDNKQWDEENMLSMGIKHHILNLKLDVIKKYCPHRDDLNNDVRLEIDRINKLIPKCKNGYVPLSGGGKIPNGVIEEILEPFKNDSLDQIIKKAIYSEFFIPDIPREVSSLTGFFSTLQFSNENLKKFNGGKQINEHGATDVLVKWSNYELDWNFRLFLFQRITNKFNRDDLLNNIFTPIQHSKVINEVSKRLFHNSLQLYFDKNYFECILISIFQIESILRDICRRNNIETISIEENKDRQKTMSSLILKLKKIVNERILNFIEWLLLNEEGQISKNYRNEIAHGLDTMNQFNEIYTKENALSIILVYLSLSKYGF